MVTEFRICRQDHILCTEVRVTLVSDLMVRCRKKMPVAGISHGAPDGYHASCVPLTGISPQENPLLQSVFSQFSNTTETPLRHSLFRVCRPGKDHIARTHEPDGVPGFEGHAIYSDVIPEVECFAVAGAIFRTEVETRIG